MSLQRETIKRLFQQEFSKMVAVISHRFGLEHIELAEDIVSDTFLQASEDWALKGLPANPTAWLYLVAKQKTLHHFRRTKIFQRIGTELKRQQPGEASLELDFSQQHIRDSQLQLMFAICDPVIAGEAQMALALRVLCGFGIEAIAEAFLSNKETISKRLFRAKEKIRSAHLKMELPPEGQLLPRLNNVLHILYLLFNEGYYSTTQNELLRQELCFEAIRLTRLLTTYKKTNRPQTNALLALMCFHASRFDARQSADAGMVIYEAQQKGLWNAELIRWGWHYLERSARGDELSSYHLEARIAAWHCSWEDTVEKWQEILQLYNHLQKINPSPAVVLNRVFALYKAHGWQAALQAAEDLNMRNSYFYFVLLGELYSHVDLARALANFQQALRLAKSVATRELIETKIDKLLHYN